MVRELSCPECQAEIDEHALTAGHGLELAALLSASAQRHLEVCQECRTACTSSLQLESRLRSLSSPLPAPDMRGAVMARIRQGQRAAYPVLAKAPPQSTGVREMVLIALTLTALVGWFFPISWLEEAGTWISMELLETLQAGWALVGGWNVGSWFVLPEGAPWASGWDTPLVLLTLALCAVYTRGWSQVQRG